MAEKGLFIDALPRDGVVTFLALVKEKKSSGPSVRAAGICTCF